MHIFESQNDEKRIEQFQCATVSV